MSDALTLGFLLTPKTFKEGKIMVRKLSRVGLGLIVVLVFSTLSIYRPGARAADRIRLSNWGKTDPIYAIPVITAEEKGIWKAHGLKLEWLPFGSGSAMHQAVAAGATDVVVSGAVSVFQAVSRGVPETIVADMGAVEEFFVWVRHDSPIKQPKDLKGAALGISRVGSVTYAYAHMLAKSLGIEKEVKIVATGRTSAAVAALRARAINASVNGLFPMAKLRSEQVVRDILAIRDYLPKVWPDVVVIARNDFLKTKPGVVRRVVKALLQSANYMLENKEWTIGKMQSVSGFSEQLARELYPRLQYSKTGKVNPEGLENVRTFLIEYGLITKEKAPQVDSIYTKEISG